MRRNRNYYKTIFNDRYTYHYAYTNNYISRKIETRTHCSTHDYACWFIESDILVRSTFLLSTFPHKISYYLPSFQIIPVLLSKKLLQLLYMKTTSFPLTSHLCIYEKHIQHILTLFNHVRTTLKFNSHLSFLFLIVLPWYVRRKCE